MLMCVTGAVASQLKYYIDNPVDADRALINETKQFWIGMVSVSGIITFVVMCITLSTIKKVNLTIKPRFEQRIAFLSQHDHIMLLKG